ncbi:MAG TPA: calcium-binding protein [Rhizomicrobium sp.]|jgi:Ca2+-binding RTX toxin-like protein|nr:calcium-binding protein [Rhizomicrobium sp.]
MASIKGTKGNDVLTGTSGNDMFNLVQGGDDIAKGLGGTDIFKFGASFTAADKINGGGGSDTLSLSGDYKGANGVTFAATTMAAVETIVVAAGNSYSLTTNDSNVAAAATLTVDGRALGAGDKLAFNGSNETNGHFALIGGAGNDNLTGGALSDTFSLTLGGADTASGGGGNDVFNLNGTFTNADKIDGGAGNDTLNLLGTYTGAKALVFKAATLSGVENIIVGAGHNYNITTVNDSVAGGAVLYVDAHALGAANAIAFNGAAETDGAFVFTGGAGNDAFTGGARSDTFDLSHGGNDIANGGGGNDLFELGAALTSADKIDGGDGNDTLSLNGTYTGAKALTFQAAMLGSVETIVLAAGHNYNITTTDASVAAATLLTIDAHALGAANAIAFNGAAETDGVFMITGGAGNDALTGGALFDTFDLSYGGNDTVSGGGANDIFIFGATFNAQDHVDGGDGNDTLSLTGNYGTLTFDGSNTVSVETVVLGAGHSYNVVMADGFTPAHHTAIIDGSLLLSTDTFTFDGTGETDGATQAIGGAGADVLVGGPNGDILQGAGGNDHIDFTHDTSQSFTATGGTGADTINVGATLVAADHIDGGPGNDTVIVSGDNFTDLITFNSATLQNVDKLEFTGSFAPGIVTNDATVATGATMKIDAHTLTGGLTFDGHLETDGHFTILGGAGTNVIEGGQLADTITGGANPDLFEYVATQSYAGDSYDTITNLDFSHDVVAIYTTTAKSAFVSPAAIDATIASGSLSASSIDVDLMAAANNSHLAAHDAVLFTPTAGDLSGQAFLIVDMNGVAGYQAGSDLVIDVTGHTGTLTTDSFGHT